MIKHEINVYLESQVKTQIKVSWFKNIIRKILDALEINVISELGLFVTNNKVIHQLNKTYRKKDEPTDVLAFSMFSKHGTKLEKFINPPDGIYHLGEIIISYPQAVYQAKEKKHDIKHELMILIIHGLLHLLGYDHEQSLEEKQRMRTKEREILRKLLSSRQNKQ